MATWIPNQPVIFGATSDSCSCDVETGAQLVDNTDETQFQFQLTNCQAAQSVIVDENFNDITKWGLGSNWAIAYNQLCGYQSSPPPAISEVSSTISLTSGYYYQMNIIVDSISGGSITIALGSINIAVIDQAGTYTFYGFSDGTTFSITKPAEVAVCISNIQLYEILTQFKFVIYDAATNSYQAQISYTNTPDYFNLTGDTLTVTVNWAELGISNGCYYICLLDPCINYNGQNIPIAITNSDFTGNADGWTLGANWSYGSNDVDWIGFSIPENNRLSQTIFPTYSYFATVKIVVTAITGDLNVYFGSVFMGTIQGTGTHVYSGTPFGGFDLILEPSVVGSGTIDSITWNAPAFYEYNCDMQSNTFKLADYSDDCTMLINACNNEDGLGFVFSGSGFTPRIRVPAKLKQAKYPNERNIYEDSLGEKRVVYYKRRKSKYLCIDLQPEYVHDFISLAFGFDNFYIDGSAYFVEDDEYNVEYSDASDNLGKVKFLVSEKILNVTNISCTSEENVCTLEESVLLQADDFTQNITLTNGELILING